MAVKKPYARPLDLRPLNSQTTPEKQYGASFSNFQERSHINISATKPDSCVETLRSLCTQEPHYRDKTHIMSEQARARIQIQMCTIRQTLNNFSRARERRTCRIEELSVLSWGSALRFWATVEPQGLQTIGLVWSEGCKPMESNRTAAWRWGAISGTMVLGESRLIHQGWVNCGHTVYPW
jgi:hypothetical protein